ncbi:MAG: hypothetical protein QOC92_1303 [Acidimicrobiaceae bacterium]|jgi:hypothetical protein
MPVARSDPRRATFVGIVGVVVGTVMIVLVLFVNNLGGGDKVRSSSSHAAFDVGPAKNLAEAVTRDQTPLLFQDPVKFQRPIFVQHLGDNPDRGWTAFDAATGNCVLTWHRESQDFTDCNGRRIPKDGGDMHHYPVKVENDHVIVDLNPDTPTTSSS